MLLDAKTDMQQIRPGGEKSLSRDTEPTECINRLSVVVTTHLRLGCFVKRLV